MHKHHKNHSHNHRIIKIIISIIKLILVTLMSGFSSIFKSIGKRLRFSITLKLSALYTRLFAVLLFILSIILTGTFYSYSYNNANQIVKNDSIIITDYIKSNMDLSTGVVADIAKKDSIDLIVSNKDKIIFTTKEGALNTSNGSSANTINSSSTLNHNGIDYKINISKVMIKENSDSMLLFIFLSVMDIIALIICFCIGYKNNRKMLRPVEDMTCTVKEISVKHLDTRLNVSGSQDELKDLAQTVNALLDRIQTAYEQQNQFVSDASHELRTPISVIAGYANLLGRWGKNDKAVLDESILAIQNESENMKNLIEKLLFLARSDKNKQKIEKQDFAINDLIYEILNETKLIDNKHNIVCTRNDIAVINADRKLIKEAIRIFIDNSIKFTPPMGTINLNCYAYKKDINIIVEDTGMGIAPEDLPYIFNRFYRSDKSRTKSSGGSGLGLSIAKWIIRKHSGTITVESRIGIGTKFDIRFPYES